MKPTLPESSYAVVVLQEAWTKLTDEPKESPGVLYTRMHWMGEFDTADAALNLIEAVPAIHAGSVSKILHEQGVIGRVRVGVYALDTQDIGASNIASMCRLGSSDSASTDGDDALRVETIREVLTTRYKPVLNTSFLLPAQSVPAWRPESAAEVVQELQQVGTWGFGKSTK
ncbi:hypothetical protein N9917_00450 [Deltaproteobacteria bacterium]|nr:hypothetical protein [Deltaproteobacteria bacterium]